MEKQRYWTVTRTQAFYTSEEDAKVLAEFLNQGYHCTEREKYKVVEVYPDCYASKIRAGYDIWEVAMIRDGTVLYNKKSNYRQAPSAFGFTSGQILPQNAFLPRGILKNPLEKAIHFRCLAKDAEDAAKQCDRYRIRRFLDDIWFKNDTRNSL